MDLSATKEQLTAVLRSAGKEPICLSNVAGQTVVVLPYGGRVLGLFTAESPTNFLWTNSALQSAAAAQAYYASAVWHNSGGDRTWLAPELEFFFPNYPDVSTYVQPRPLDAGEFVVRQTGSQVILETQFPLRFHRAKCELPINLVKRISLANDPLHTRHVGPHVGQLQFAGFRLHTSLRLLSSAPASAWVGVWNLLQLPNGGTLLAPLYYEIQPTVFFGEIPSGDLDVRGNLIRYRMRAEGEQKISIPAIATTGRVGYRYSLNGEEVLIVRNFQVDPARRYVDVWRTRPEDDGYAVQACNIRSRWGEFAEMEYHAPAIGGSTGLLESHDVSSVWAYRGSAEAIRWATQILLGVAE